MSRVYMDSASMAPLRPSAREAMRLALDLPAADPGRLHTEAMEVRAHLEHARSQVAKYFNARPSEIVFNSSASEGLATVVKGFLSQGAEPVVVGSAVEHSAIRLPAGERFVSIPVTEEGLVTAEALSAALDQATRDSRPVALIAIQLGNHEMGAIQPIGELATIANALRIPILVDAAQAAPWHPIDVRSFEPTFLAVSGPKMGAPAGTGALVIRRGARTPPLIMGGAQERGRRAGMENVPGALALGAVCEELTETLADEIDRASHLTKQLRDGLAALSGVTLLGPIDPQHRLPHLTCCEVQGVEPQAVLIELDRAGIAAHSGSACAAEDLEPSPVLAAMGLTADRSLRLSLHCQSTQDEVDRVLVALPQILSRLRALST